MIRVIVQNDPTASGNSLIYQRALIPLVESFGKASLPGYEEQVIEIQTILLKKSKRLTRCSMELIKRLPEALAKWDNERQMSLLFPFVIFCFKFGPVSHSFEFDQSIHVLNGLIIKSLEYFRHSIRSSEALTKTCLLIQLFIQNFRSPAFLEDIQGMMCSSVRIYEVSKDQEGNWDQRGISLK